MNLFRPLKDNFTVGVDRYVKITNTKGFTLVELIVTLLISVILLAVAGTILLSSFQLFSKSASDNEAKLIGDSVMQFLSDQITYAPDLQLIDQQDTTTPPQYTNQIRIVGGKLYYQTGSQPETNYFGDEFYLNTNVQITVKTSGNNIINLTVDVLKNEKPLYQTESAVNLLNIRLKSGSIAGKTDSELINPQIVFSNVKKN